MSLDPQNPLVHTTVGQVLAHARRFDEALKAFQEARALDPSSKYIHDEYVDALLGAGQFEKARRLCEDLSIPLNQNERHLYLAIAYDALGRTGEAERELSELKDPWDYAQFYGRRGDKRSAFRWLAEAERLGRLQQLKNAWEFDPVRDEPEFKAIVARMNYPP